MGEISAGQIFKGQKLAKFYEFIFTNATFREILWDKFSKIGSFK